MNTYTQPPLVPAQSEGVLCEPTRKEVDIKTGIFVYSNHMVNLVTHCLRGRCQQSKVSAPDR